MPLTVEELRAKSEEVRAYGWSGRPEAAERVPAADVLPHLDSEDRNIRVAALRVLAWCDGPEAIEGILRGLDDPMKRVRNVAAKSSVRFVSDPKVVARLRRAVDEDEPGSGRPAMEVLGGAFSSPLGLYQLEPVAGAIRALAEHPKHREKALASLLRSERLIDETTDILRDFVRNGTKEEAVFATRRLDGFRIVHDGWLTAEQRASAERAHGRVWWWVRVS
jgi:HEAT repeat protein